MENVKIEQSKDLPADKGILGARKWDDFRSAGMLFFINMILHAFGWAIVVEVDEGIVTNVYPARVGYRGFDEQSQDEEHVKIAEYLAMNAPHFPEEIK
jgi:hypothetical protein